MSINQLKTAKIRLISSLSNQLDNNNQLVSHYYDYICSRNRIEVVIRCLRPQQSVQTEQRPPKQFDSDESNQSSSEYDDVFAFLTSKKINDSNNTSQHVQINHRFLTIKNYLMISPFTMSKREYNKTSKPAEDTVQNQKIQ